MSGLVFLCKLLNTITLSDRSLAGTPFALPCPAAWWL